MQAYQFAFQLKNCRVPLDTRVPLQDLREAHRYAMSLIRHMLECAGPSSAGWVLRICDAGDEPLLHVIVPAQLAACGAVGESIRGERVRDEAWSAAMAKLEALAMDCRAGQGRAGHGRHDHARVELARDALSQDGSAGTSHAV